VGNTKPERELSRARGEYIAAVARLRAAMQTYLAAGVPLDPGRDSRAVPPWTAEHVQVVIETRDAWRHLVATRYAYDQLRRQLRYG